MTIRFLVSILRYSTYRAGRLFPRRDDYESRAAGKGDSMAETLTSNRLRDLAGFRSEAGCAVSLYLDLDPALSPTPAAVDSRVNSLLSDAEKRLAARRNELDHEERRGLRRDFARIRNFFESDFNRDRARGYAVFVCGDFWHEIALAHPVADRVTIGTAFHVGPLASHVGRGDGALVAFVGREKGQLFRLRGGRLEEVSDLTEDQPSRHDQGGWSQANYRRHIEKLVGEHLRDVAAELDREIRRLRTPNVVVVGSEETRAEFLETLAPEVKSAIVGTTEAEAHAGPTELLQLVRPLIEEAEAKDEHAAIERWREEAGKDGRAASGWAETLDAASDARVEVLLYAEGANTAAHECPQCGRASLEGGSCPLDGTALEPRESGFDLAVQRTLANGGTLLAVRHQVDLGAVGGIAALLRF
jgi:peptide subunit release factor 1 (eRF1)